MVRILTPHILLTIKTIIMNITDLILRHQKIMTEKNILVFVYTNASGFLWGMCKVDSGTDLGYSDYSGDCEFSGAFTTYEKAWKHALDLIDKCDLKQFQNETPNNKFHWGNYANHLIKKYGTKNS